MIDLIIILVLVFFAWRGAKKGLILTVFSFLAIFVAFFGAREISTRFSEPIADIIKPSIQLSIDEILVGETPTGSAILSGESESDTDDSADSGESEGETVITRDFSLRQILTLIEENELFEGFQEYLDEAIAENAIAVTTTAAAAIAAHLAALVAKAFLFGLSFVVILLVWFLASRALDLAFKLPILSAINTVGGLLFGLAKGVIIILVLVWLGKLAGWLTEANIGPITSMMTAERLSELLRGVIAGTYMP